MVQASTPPYPSASDPESLRHELAKLSGLILAHSPYDGVFDLRLPGVQVIRVSHPHKELVHGLHRATLCMVAQGAKRVLLGQDIFEYDASRMLVSSVDVPVAAQVTQASPSEPFLGLKLDLDARRIADLVLKVYPHGLPQVRKDRAVYVAQVDPGLLAATARLLELMAQPEEADLLGPLVVDEILIRLLRSPVGGRVAQIGQEESKVHRVSKAVSWVQAHFDQPLDVERLAVMVHMSPSSFHHHFKAVTSMSPLQFQKVLRLQEARRLMLSRMMDAGTASRQVGYLSASQFSREYSRNFGNAPTKDIARLREGGAACELPAE
ncbi:MAG TPA: AraC family transcriptional regulator [Holophaga sp.]|nr:AraC family transcriptional regulator [Holophaga sp.]HPS69068.1 AraC family transcriptional regulator [Holophaga sp.]